MLIVTLVSILPYRSDDLQDNGDFNSRKKEIIANYKNRIEELNTNMLEIKARIQKKNEDLGVQKEQIVDQNYIRLEAIKNELEQELKVLKNLTEKDSQEIEKAKDKLDQRNKEIKQLFRKIKKKLNKNEFKS